MLATQKVLVQQNCILLKTIIIFKEEKGLTPIEFVGFGAPLVRPS